MLAKKERIIWIFAVATSVIFTFLVTPKLTIVSENKDNIAPPSDALTDIEQVAEQWFTSTTPPTRFPPIPPRYQYNQENIDTLLLIYQGGIEHQEPWINFPEQIVLRMFYPPSEIEGFTPNSVIIYYYNADILTVTVKVAGPYAISERRVDFVKADNGWKIVWAGQRSIYIN